jgi:hypothetical protein
MMTDYIEALEEARLAFQAASGRLGKVRLAIEHAETAILELQIGLESDGNRLLTKFECGPRTRSPKFSICVDRAYLPATWPRSAKL